MDLRLFRSHRSDRSEGLRLILKSLDQFVQVARYMLHLGEILLLLLLSLVD